MAGETPGASNVNKRRKLNWQDDKSTDKIYASGNVSALGNRTVADSVLKPGQAPVGIKTPVVKPDDKSADKYYAQGGSGRHRHVAGQKKPPGPPPKLGVAPKPAALPNGQLRILDKSEVNGVFQSVIDKLQGGESPVVVYIKAGDSNLLRRARSSLDLLVAREVITEDQARDVRLSYELSHAEEAAVATKLGVPEAKETIRVEDNESITVDPLAFLSGEGDDPEDPVVDTSALPVTEVDTTADVPNDPILDDEDDAGEDFLKDRIADVQPLQADEIEPGPLAEAIEAAVAPPEAPKRKSKRSGRGS